MTRYRHHCRHCRGSFCHEHAWHEHPIPKLGLPAPQVEQKGGAGRPHRTQSLANRQIVKSLAQGPRRWFFLHPLCSMFFCHARGPSPRHEPSRDLLYVFPRCALVLAVPHRCSTSSLRHTRVIAQPDRNKMMVVTEFDSATVVIVACWSRCATVLSSTVDCATGGGRHARLTTSDCCLFFSRFLPACLPASDPAACVRSAGVHPLQAHPRAGGLARARGVEVGAG